MRQGTGARTGRVVVVYTAWLVLLLTAGVILIRGDDLLIFGVLPWFAAMLAAIAGSDEMEGLCRAGLGRFVARLAFVLMGVLLVVTMAAGPPSYLAALGQRGTAIVTEVEPFQPDQLYHRCRVSLAATERDLGWISREQCGLRRPGDVIEVSYDPRGWVVPMAAHGLPASHTGVMVIVMWLLAATGTAATAITATVLDPPGERR